MKLKHMDVLIMFL